MDFCSVMLLGKETSDVRWVAFNMNLLLTNDDGMNYWTLCYTCLNCNRSERTFSKSCERKSER